MALFNNIPHATKSLRVLARLLGYPGAELRGHLADLRGALHEEHALPPQRLAELDALIETLQRKEALEVEADYVELFDRAAPPRFTCSSMCMATRATGVRP